MRFLRILAVVAVTQSLVHSAASAQRSQLQSGVRARLSSLALPSDPYEAVISDRRGDSLTVVRLNSPAIGVAIASLVRADVYQGGSRWVGARRGISVGLVAGFVAGMLLSARPGDSGDANCGSLGSTCRRSSDYQKVAAVAGGAAFVGAGIGAIVRRDKWRTLDLSIGDTRP